MSLWTDRELKALITRVNELEVKIRLLEHGPLAAFGGFAENRNGLANQEPADKRTREWREWKNSTS